MDDERVAGQQRYARDMQWEMEPREMVSGIRYPRSSSLAGVSKGEHLGAALARKQHRYVALM